MKMPNGAVVVAAQSIENGVVNAVAPPLEGHVRGCHSRFGVLRRAESGDRWIDVVLRRSGRPERRAPDVGGELGGAGSSAKRRSTS